MKKLLLLLTAVFFIFSVMNFNVSAQLKLKPPKDVKKEMTVPGNTAWVNTGIRISPKDKVIISASGTVCFENASESCVGPQGWPVDTYRQAWPNNWNYCDDPLKTENHAALIGEMGSDKFFVGNQLTFSGKDGFLYLGINDCTLNGTYGNTGEFTVIIQVKRKKTS
ncbi:MAG: hypothetical protein KAX11_09585 [Candidatus Aminicenantes bacterium]|nr:hypothetical protein [Candidatus Aminicenantes bacterium]